MRNELTEDLGELVNKMFKKSGLVLHKFIADMEKNFSTVLSSNETGFHILHDGHLVHVYCVNNTFYAKI